MRIVSVIVLGLLVSVSQGQVFTTMDVEELHDEEHDYLEDYYYDCRNGVVYYNEFGNISYSFSPLFDEEGEVIYCDEEIRMENRLIIQQ